MLGGGLNASLEVGPQKYGDATDADGGKNDPLSKRGCRNTKPGKAASDVIHDDGAE